MASAPGVNVLTFIQAHTDFAVGTPLPGDVTVPGASGELGVPWVYTGIGAGPQPGVHLEMDVHRENQGLGPVHIIHIDLFLKGSNVGPQAAANVQCPWDDGDGMLTDDMEAGSSPSMPRVGNVACLHVSAGDGFSRMGDGTEMYAFSYSDLSDVTAAEAIDKGILNAQFPAPLIEFEEGDEAYLTLTNVGMLMRPDLFDAHTIHFHGFPNAASVFDGVPEASISINMGFSLTYYYNIVEPGTYLWHCHFEATEHMQMGMIGNLYVHPAQDRTGYGPDMPGTIATRMGGTGGDAPLGYVYNDGDGTTGFDVEKAIQVTSFDSAFHNASLTVQPLPFANMRDDYPLLNGRGYPDTVKPGDLPVVPGGDKETSGVVSASASSNVEDSRVVATVGDKIILRINNVSVTQFYTFAISGGLTMQIVGRGAHILRGPDGEDLYYETHSITLGGGDAVDVMIDTAGVAAGTYMLYSTNLNELSNGTQDFGGLMTEIVIN